MSAMAQDRSITQQVLQRLATKGFRSPCRIDVQSKNGEVTLSGSLQYAYQRASALQAAATASGVRHVVDRLTIKPNTRRS